MIAEEIEFQISQYVDGTLSAAEMKYVDDLVQSDAEAQKVLADYRRLNAQLGQLRDRPVVQWDKLAGSISDEIERSDRPVVAGRIGFSFSRWRIAAAVLVAATAVLTAGHVMRSHPSKPVLVPTIVDVNGPEAEVAKGPSVQDVTVGPSPAFVRNDPRYGEGVIRQGPPKILLGEIPKPPTDLHRN